MYSSTVLATINHDLVRFSFQGYMILIGSSWSALVCAFFDFHFEGTRSILFILLVSDIYIQHLEVNRP